MFTEKNVRVLLYLNTMVAFTYEFAVSHFFHEYKCGSTKRDQTLSEKLTLNLNNND